MKGIRKAFYEKIVRVRVRGRQTDRQTDKHLREKERKKERESDRGRVKMRVKDLNQRERNVIQLFLKVSVITSVCHRFDKRKYKVGSKKQN